MEEWHQSVDQMGGGILTQLVLDAQVSVHESTYYIIMTLLPANVWQLVHYLFLIKLSTQRYLCQWKAKLSISEELDLKIHSVIGKVDIVEFYHMRKWFAK